MNIHFVQAGGTVDKQYPRNPDNHGYNFTVGEPAFLRILTRAGFESSQFTHSVACQKDSLDMDDINRSTVATHAEEAPSDFVIVTHGTDTIYQTARTVGRMISSRKVVILTGAMQPAEFRDSGADFNLGMAVAAVQILPPGVYIALDGKVVPWYDYVPS